MTAFDLAGPLPTGTTVIQASAGTGKTYAIIGLAARYIADGVDVSQLMLVTFSRTATRELRDRARSRLRACADALADPEEARTSGDEVIVCLATGTDDEVALRRSRLLRALSEFDAATIVTTHSFCQRMLDGIGMAGDYEPDTAFLENTADLVGEVITDRFAAEHCGADGSPLTLRTAREVAGAAANDPQAVVEPADAEPESEAAARARFADEVRVEVDRRKRIRSIRDFNDLLVLLRNALADPDFGPIAAQRIRQRYRVVLVDEFQDTDPLQWDILHRTFDGFVTLILVGDPKQAIYAFRGADVSTYLEAVRTAGSPYELDVNRRSDSGLLKALEHLYGDAALGDDAIAVDPVQPWHRQSRLAGGAPLRLRYLSRAAAGVSRGEPRVPAVRARIAADVADDIVATLESGELVAIGDGAEPLQPSDIAVLVRTGDQGNLIRDALRSAGVPCVFTGGASVFSTAEALAWQRVLAAIEQPHRSDRLRLAALTPLLGYNATELATGGDALQSALATRIRRWAVVFAESGPAALFEIISAETNLEPWLLRLDGGERTVTDLRHLAALLDRATLSEAPGISALVRWLHSRMADERVTPSTDRGRLLDRESAAVRIVTVHAAKGLQFPVAYLPYAWDRPRHDKPEVLLLHENGRRLLDVGGKQGPHYTQRADIHTAEEAGEQLRLFYVAATRAQCRVVAWWAPTKQNTATSPLHRLLFGRHPGQPHPDDEPTLPDDDVLPGRLADWAAGAGDVISVEAVPPQPAGAVWSPPPDDVRELTLALFERALSWEWRRTSYTALTRGLHQQDRALSEPEQPGTQDEHEGWEDPLRPPGPGAAPSLMNSLAGGTAFGTLVHAVLEHVDTSAPDLAAEVRARCIEASQRLYSTVDVDTLATALQAVLATPTPCGRLADIAPADRLVEVDFELPLAGGDDTALSAATLAAIADLLGAHLDATDPLAGYPTLLRSVPATTLRGYLTGSLDAVLRLRGPRYVVVDYKTNRLFAGNIDAASYDQPAMAAAMLREHYPLQALLYSVALHRYLRWRQPGYQPETHLGGVMYLFVRAMAGEATPDGCGVFSWKPPAGLVVALSDLLAGK